MELSAKNLVHSKKCQKSPEDRRLDADNYRVPSILTIISNFELDRGKENVIAGVNLS